MTIIGGTPNYTISWDNGAITEDISDLTPGDYTVIITDENSCVYTETVSIDSSSEITIEIMKRMKTYYVLVIVMAY